MVFKLEEIRIRKKKNIFNTLSFKPEMFKGFLAINQHRMGVTVKLKRDFIYNAMSKATKPLDLKTG